ncbi:glycosyltransferase [Pedobacter sp. AW31-3R]|uniref:glycosyltransferase n=1 Tax=Pedobacter sp. AW31-3R TaxID=3445781 RepID=UPI003F9F2735
MRRVLIISPYFAPSNAADMHRVRMSLPYFSTYGWEAEVVTVQPEHSEMQKDDLLLQSIPDAIKIHFVDAFSKRWTSKIGLGNLALRSLYFYFRSVNRLLKTGNYDLVYFSTTQFPVCILGAYWKKVYNIPYVIDMQDPWHSDYYKDKPKSQQPAKYWFSYRLNKYLEPLAMRYVGGLISVSAAYLSTLRKRYPRLNRVPSSVITFGVLEEDFHIAMRHKKNFSRLLQTDKLNVVYIGRGGEDMHLSVTTLFEAMKKGQELHPDLFNTLHFYFIGTSYAPAGEGKPSILPLAEKYQLGRQVTEHTDRISFYHALQTVQDADLLFVPGSDDPQYTASKIYPLLFSRKPLIAVFHDKSSVIEVIGKCSSNAVVVRFSDEDGVEKIYEALTSLANRNVQSLLLHPAMEEHTAENKSRMQVDLFNRVVRNP